ncbi:hypothetical protein CO731_04859 [Aminobacter sp. MSH1]|uniref:hypothetical protein n=1 Tax=Aminobacter sp. MSH1 TaxID=374606 RepID=UPI000D37A76F|nr:hypothetical protein [Aminobacter sp. MSH1]AWC25364.1 hypothetical protein CO731_04859 [Aminobacter sp. MSH1]
MGGSNKSTQTTSNEPYSAAKPLLNQTMGDAHNLYKNGGLVKPNTQSTVVPYAQQTTQAMGGLQSLGQANTGGQGLSGQYQGIIDSGGYNQEQQDALSGIRSTATGQFDPNGNPAFQQVLQQAQDAASNAAKLNASGAGRYGSGTHEGVMAKQVGDLTSRMVGDEYRNWQGRQDQAQQQLFNAGQQGQSNMGNAYKGMQDAYNPLLQVGAMNEDLYGRNLNDQLRITQEQQNLPLANIQALQGIASGAGNLGTSTSTAQGPSNTFSNIAGAGLGGASLLSGGGGKL